MMRCTTTPAMPRLLALAFVVAWLATTHLHAAFSVVASGTAKSTNGTSVSLTLDTTGANLIVISVSSLASVSAPTLSDNQSNTWTPLTERTASNSRQRIYYCIAPSVNASHQFSLSGASSTPVIGVLAVSGAAASPFSAETGAVTTSASELQPGEITPAEDNMLIVTGCTNAAALASAPDIASGWTVSKQAGTSGVNMGGGIAYQIQTTATAVNPTWAWTGTNHAAAAMAVFYEQPQGLAKILQLLSHHNSRVEKRPLCYVSCLP